jgi:hypothetical protein
MGTEPIEAVDVVKNGRVIYSRSYLTPRIDPRLTLQVEVSSSSEVGSYRPPRGERGWRGSVQVDGAHVTGYEPPWFANPTRYLVRRDPANPDRLEFLTTTRGRAKGLRVDLEGASEATTVHVDVDELGRTLRAGPNPASIEVPLARLLEGPVRRELVDNEDTDWVEVAIVPGDAALDLEFEFADLGALEPGDYYYLRVRQVGGGMAFSSPWRVTGAREAGED